MGALSAYDALVASFTLRTSIAAQPEVVFEVLTDHRAYAQLTPLRSSTLEREGTPAPNGVGAIRVLKLAGPPLREEVTEFEPPSRFSYRLLSGAPVSDHHATVELTAVGSSTALRWHVESTPKIPVPDSVWAATVKQVIKPLLKGVARESERRGRATA